ncbi:hypothetical protein TVAG_420230 [Trichomonas vaginalis G3]|uniref:Uncharacterized protein n=1 Tax=Trichomonas vaginalis (strain ATCC PRA-98 / G3) TaxID=412133 RepID=A2ED46_TRIV3|nr:hypothetical protein TVAGG3_0424850 [Trichomonas vaginalis G3]EAY09401.1 hypothetical protein TVAG_420230 [Trichomonas vaginalis G3]KAI5536320.1 hypothetical protein TVAGG3_0424850 [Trichomonas vaginalis G3]|eukprot:XP_001321624.1 hypothetical protein [Trichomonas vaginalis G3]
MSIKLNIVETIPTSLTEIQEEAWLVINSEKSSSPVSTIPFLINKTSYVDSTISLAVNLDNIENSFLYFTLCCYYQGNDDIIPLARTKVRIGNIPLDGVTHFQIPLYGHLNIDDQIITITLVGTLLKSDQPDLNIQEFIGSNTYIY